LADLLRMNRLPGGVDRPTTNSRAARTGALPRGKLVALRSGLKAQAHAVLPRRCVIAVSDLFGVEGRQRLPGCRSSRLRAAMSSLLE